MAKDTWTTDSEQHRTSYTSSIGQTIWGTANATNTNHTVYMYIGKYFPKTSAFDSIAFAEVSHWCRVKWTLAAQSDKHWIATKYKQTRRTLSPDKRRTWIETCRMLWHAEREWQRSSHWSHCMLSSFTTIIIAIIGCAYYIYNIVSAMDIFIPRTLTIRFFLFVLNVCLLIFSSLYFNIFSVILLLLMISYVLWEKEHFMCASVW